MYLVSVLIWRFSATIDVVLATETSVIVFKLSSITLTRLKVSVCCQCSGHN